MPAGLVPRLQVLTPGLRAALSGSRRPLPRGHSARVLEAPCQAHLAQSGGSGTGRTCSTSWAGTLGAHAAHRAGHAPGARSRASSGHSLPSGPRGSVYVHIPPPGSRSLLPNPRGSNGRQVRPARRSGAPQVAWPGATAWPRTGWAGVGSVAFWVTTAHPWLEQHPARRVPGLGVCARRTAGLGLSAARGPLHLAPLASGAPSAAAGLLQARADSAVLPGPRGGRNVAPPPHPPITTRSSHLPAAWPAVPRIQAAPIPEAGEGKVWDGRHGVCAHSLRVEECVHVTLAHFHQRDVCAQLKPLPPG